MTSPASSLRYWLRGAIIWRVEGRQSLPRRLSYVTPATSFPSPECGSDPHKSGWRRLQRWRCSAAALQQVAPFPDRNFSGSDDKDADDTSDACNYSALARRQRPLDANRTSMAINMATLHRNPHLYLTRFEARLRRLMWP